VEGTLFALPYLTVNCPQVVSRILFYNEMQINLDHDFKSIILERKITKVRYVTSQGRKAIWSQREKKTGEESIWGQTDM
jgi:hypothetical protein